MHVVRLLGGSSSNNRQIF